MDNKITYHEQNDIDNTLKLREVLKTLPPFCRDYFRAIDATTTTKTRISYAYDIRIFFQFLLDQNPMFKDKNMSDFTVDVLDQIKAVDLEEYEEFLKVYKSADSSKTETNGERGVKRKISALRSFYAYYYKHEMITTNPSVLIDVPKIHIASNSFITAASSTPNITASSFKSILLFFSIKVKIFSLMLQFLQLISDLLLNYFI